MSPYHQGPPFPVSSSPILPLEVQPSRTKRPSPLPLLPLSDYPHRFSASSGHWTGNASAVCPNPSGLRTGYMHNTTSTTGLTTSLPYPPLRPLASTPAGWDVDLPTDLVPHASLVQGSQGGTTFFYRSPTPSARQRTNQACEKCRDRKTKVFMLFHVMVHQAERNECSAAVDARPVFVVKLGDSFVNMPLSIEFAAQRKPECGTYHRLNPPFLPLQLDRPPFIILMLFPPVWDILRGTCSLPKLRK
jgi:hypothetical protein